MLNEVLRSCVLLGYYLGLSQRDTKTQAVMGAAESMAVSDSAARRMIKDAREACALNGVYLPGL